MKYYLDYAGTGRIFFDEKSNLITALENCLDLADARAEEGIDIDINLHIGTQIQKNKFLKRVK